MKKQDDVFNGNKKGTSECPAKDNAEECGCGGPENAEEWAPPEESAEMKNLRNALEAKNKECAEALDKFMRSRADFDNYKKRVEKEKASLLEFANETFAKELLNFPDNLERALHHSREGTDNGVQTEALRSGIELTLKGISDAFKKFGIEAVPALGKKFDHSRHEALGFEDTSESEDGIVTKEVQKGYMFGERLLRPSLVIVAKNPSGREGGAEGL
ncbi:MAG: nucleotide exchange factor GrpE [Thermodesulfobacteriota bacterium]